MPLAINLGVNIGDTVKYSRPLEGEADFRFILLWIEKGKVDIQLICDWTLKPVSIVAEDEIVPAHKS